MNYAVFQFRRYNAAFVIAALYLSERVVGEVPSFNRQIIIGNKLNRILAKAPAEQHDTIEKLRTMVRVPSSFDPVVAAEARDFISTYIAEGTEDDEMNALAALIDLAHRRRIAFAETFRLYTKYNIVALETHHAEPSKGRTVHA